VKPEAPEEESIAEVNARLIAKFPRLTGEIKKKIIIKKNKIK
jgi:hypothetical protein